MSIEREPTVISTLASNPHLRLAGLVLASNTLVGPALPPQTPIEAVAMMQVIDDTSSDPLSRMREGSDASPAVLPTDITFVNAYPFTPDGADTLSQEDMQEIASDTVAAMNAIDPHTEYTFSIADLPGNVASGLRKGAIINQPMGKDNNTKQPQTAYDCLNTAEGSAAARVKEAMPELATKQHVIVIGGDACPQPVITPDGTVYKDVGGLTEYGNQNNNVSVYPYTPSLSPTRRDTLLSNDDIVGLALHEFGHDKGFGHKSRTACYVYESKMVGVGIQPVSGQTNLSDLYTTKQEEKTICNNIEYDSGQIMGVTYGKKAEDPEEWNRSTDPLQIEVVLDPTPEDRADVLPVLREGETVSLSAYDTEHPAQVGQLPHAVRYDLPKPITITYDDSADGKQGTFDDLCFAYGLVGDRPDAPYIRPYLCNTPTDDVPFSVVELALLQMKSPDKGMGPEFTLNVGDMQITFTQDQTTRVVTAQLQAMASAGPNLPQ